MGIWEWDFPKFMHPSIWANNLRIASMFKLSLPNLVSLFPPSCPCSYVLQPDQSPTPANNHMSASAGIVEGVEKANSEQLKATRASGLSFSS